MGTVALLGGFSHKHLPDISLLGQSSFNLNGLLNPQGWSQVLTSLPVYGVNSSEGLAFPGTGILLTLAVGTVAWLLHLIYRIFVKRDKESLQIQWSWEENGVAYLVLVVISVLVAVSPKAAYGSDLIWNLDLPNWLYSLWQRIGSCGRFIWPVVYLVILGSVVWMEKKMPWETMTCQTIRSLAADHLQEEMNNVQADTLYIYKAAEEDKCFNPKMEYAEVDGVIVGKVK